MFALYPAEKMNKTMGDFDAAIEHATEYEKTQVDLDGMKSEDILVTPDGKLQIQGADELRMTPTAFDKVLGLVGIPGNYATRIPNDLIEHSINRLMRERENKTPLMIRTQEDENGERYIRTVMTERYKPVQDSKILQTTKEMVEKNSTQIEKWIIRFNPDMMRVNGIMPIEIAPKLNKGDVSKIGFEVVNGTTGLCSIGVNTFVYRLVCTNGMVAPTSVAGFRKAHVGKEFYEMISSGIADSINAAGILTNLWDLSTTKNVSGLSKNRLDVVKRNVSTILRTKNTNRIFAENAGATVYDLLNSITREAHNVPNVIQRRQLESYAGELLAIMN